MLDYRLEPVFSFTLKLEDEYVGFLPDGFYLTAHSKGGDVMGPKVKGKVRPVGGNWPVLRPDGVIDADFRLTIETDDGALIYLACHGRVDFGEEDYRNLAAGKGAGSTRIRKLRLGGQCLTSHPSYLWLNRVYCLAIGEFDAVTKIDTFDVYAVS